MSKILVAGGGGFIGGALTAKLLEVGHEVVVADIKPETQWYQRHDAATNVVIDLERREACYDLVEGAETVYNLACNMGGLGFITTHRAVCMLSVLVNTHLLMAARDLGVGKYFFASSACIYPEKKQEDPENTGLREEDAYPANPEQGYGWEKLFSERLCQRFREDFGVNVRIARFHNTYGPHGSWANGREKAPAALSRKVAEAKLSGKLEVDIWGDGEQSRSFTYIDDCVTGIEKLMANDFSEPVNLGSTEMVTINRLLDMIEGIAGVKVERKYNLEAPQGVRGRNSDNELIRKVLGWEPEISLQAGLEKTYAWVDEQVQRRARGENVLG